MRSAILSAAMALFACGAAADEETVRQALRAAIMDQPVEIPRAPGSAIDDNLAALYVAVNRSSRDEWREKRRGAPLDTSTKAFDQLLKESNPAEAFLEARRNRKYVNVRRIYNGIALPFVYLAQGQLLSLFFLPINLTEEIFTGHRYLNPEQRKERQAAKTLLESSASAEPETLAQARDAAQTWEERRQRMTAIQAAANAERAEEEKRFASQEFWTKRSILSAGERKSRDTIEALTEAEAERRRERSLSYSMLTGEVAGPEREAMRPALHALLTSNNSYPEAAAEYRNAFPAGVYIAELDAGEAALDRQEGDLLASNIRLETLGELYSRLPWGKRIEALRTKSEFNPGYTLSQANRKRAQLRRRFVLTGEPAVKPPHISAEQARREKLTFFSSGRRLFLTDAIARLIFLPFRSGFPRTALLDEANRIPEQFYETRQGLQWAERIARAYGDEKRYDDAAEWWMKAGRADRAEQMHEEAAEELEERAEDRSSDSAAAKDYRELLERYPDYQHANRVRERLEELERRLASATAVSVDEFRDHPSLGRLLGIPPELYDGKKSNGEISNNDLLIQSSQAVYTDQSDGEFKRIDLDPEQSERFLRELVIVRRQDQMEDIRRKRPAVRKKAPLALEAGAFPGFEIHPSLVPLEPDMEERRLYE